MKHKVSTCDWKKDTYVVEITHYDYYDESNPKFVVNMTVRKEDEGSRWGWDADIFNHTVPATGFGYAASPEEAMEAANKWLQEQRAKHKVYSV